MKGGVNVSDKKLTQAEIYKIRYHIYRKAGYSATEARKLRSRKLDIEGLKLENGKVPFENKSFKKLVENIDSNKVYSSKAGNKKLSQAEIYKIRYHIYRKAGYSAAEARKLRSRKLDIEGLSLENGEVPSKNKTFKKLVENIDYNKKIDNFRDYYYKNVDGDKNDTVYSSWGAITHDKRYKDKTARVVKKLQERHNLSINQGYYMLYMMTTHNMSYQTAVSELLSNEQFEMYRKSKSLKTNRKRKI